MMAHACNRAEIGRVRQEDDKFNTYELRDEFQANLYNRVRPYLNKSTN